MFPADRQDFAGVVIGDELIFPPGQQGVEPCAGKFECLRGEFVTVATVFPEQFPAVFTVIGNEGAADAPTGVVEGAAGDQGRGGIFDLSGKVSKVA